MLNEVLRESKSRLPRYHRELLSGKKLLLAFIICLLILISGCSRKLPDQSKVTFLPKQPKRSETLTVSFTPGVNSPLAKADSIVMQALFVPGDVATAGEIYKNAKMNEIPMKKKGISWIAEITADTSTGCIVFQFESDDKFDNNHKKGWDILLYSESDKPVKGAYSAFSQTLGSRGISSSMNLERVDTDSALALYEKELMLYPDNWRAKTISFVLRAGEAKKDKNEKELAKIEAELDIYLAEHPQNIRLLEVAKSYYGRSNPEKSAQAMKRIEKLDPKNIFVLYKKLQEISRIQEVKERLKKLESLEEGIWDTDLWFSWSYYTLKAFSALDKWEDLVQVAKKTINKIKTDGSGAPALTKKKRDRNKTSRIYNPLIKLAQAYSELGKKDEAGECFNELSKFELSSNRRVTLWENYLQLLVDTGQLEKAMDIGQKAIEKAESNDKIVELFKAAYTEKTGDAETAEQLVTEAKKKAGTFRKEEIAKTFITDAQPAPEFTLKNLDGEEISLASLRGKTVIVDFWATWCGPCKASFPFLQKFWEQHQNDPDVMVFAVNTREQKEGEERITAVKKFLTDNNYTFPVLFDNNDNEVMTAYKVSGIPTKLFIGPDGKIYFKEIGFHGPGMADDMNIQLAMIKEKVKL